VLGLNPNKDTTITFLLPQAKFLLKQHYKVLELTSLDSICEAQRRNDKVIIFQKTKENEDFMFVNKNNEEKLFIKDNEIKGLKTDLSNEKKSTRRQKVYKVVAIGVGGALSSYLGYKCLTK
jgi:hypothetical protein